MLELRTDQPLQPCEVNCKPSRLHRDEDLSEDEALRVGIAHTKGHLLRIVGRARGHVARPAAAVLAGALARGAAAEDARRRVLQQWQGKGWHGRIAPARRLHGAAMLARADGAHGVGAGEGPHPDSEDDGEAAVEGHDAGVRLPDQRCVRELLHHVQAQQDGGRKNGTEHADPQQEVRRLHVEAIGGHPLQQVLLSPLHDLVLVDGREITGDRGGAPDVAGHQVCRILDVLSTCRASSKHPLKALRAGGADVDAVL
mmetsp:Transcript_57458/g.159031  ORF Transcript_57458/g.159031 Transcript_57458/m.159031 type:complete len:256 (-) Transcript_57458:589-1356(-)